MRKAGDVLESLFTSRFGPEFAAKAKSTAGLFSAWAGICSEVWPSYEKSEKGDFPPAASHSAIRELEKRSLLVEADHPGWVQLLQTKQKELLFVTRRRFPELGIRSISFCLSREPFSISESKGGCAPEDSEYFSLLKTSLDETDETKKTAANRTEDGNDKFYSALKSLEKSVKKRRPK